MPQVGKVRNGLADPLVVVDAHRVDLWKRRGAIHHDERHSMGGQLFEDGRLAPEHHHRNAIHLALQHAPDRHRDTGCVIRCRSKQDLIAAFDRELFETLDQLREKRIGDLRHHQADDVAASGDQGASLWVWLVVKLADRSPHAVCHLAVYGALAIGDARDSGDGDTGATGHVADIHPDPRLFCFCTLLHGDEYRGWSTEHVADG